MFTIEMQPKKLADIFGLVEQKREIASFVDNFKSQQKKALLLHGPVGSGKTSLVHAFCAERSYELLEINASDKRTAEDIQNLVGNAVKQLSLFHSKKIVLIDEVDGMHGTHDRGGVSELAKIVEETHTPIIMTCNDVWKQSLSGLRAKCKLAEFKPRAKMEIASILKQTCDRYGIAYDLNTLSILAEKSQGDVRAAFNDLQLAISGNILDKVFVESMEKRITERDIFEGMQRIFRSNDYTEVIDAPDHLNMELPELFMWLSENIPFEMQDRKKAADAFEYLSKADVNLGRIKRQQYYHLFWHAKLISMLGVNLANKGKVGWSKYSRPARLLKLWNTSGKRSLRNSILHKIGKTAHTGRSKSAFYLPLLKSMAKAGKIDEEEFDEKELAFLRN